MSTDDTVTYLSALEPHVESHEFYWSGLHPDGRRIQQFGTLEEMLPRLQQRNEDGFGIFTTVNAIDNPSYEDGYPRRRTQDISRVRAVFADLDDPNKPTPIPLLEPSMIVETSPGKMHIYWLVDDMPLLKYEQVQRGIAQWMGSDPSVVDLSRELRVPGFLHTKDLTKRHAVSVLQCLGHRYKAEQLIEAFPFREHIPKFSSWAGAVPPRARLTAAVVDFLYGPPREDGAYNVPCAWINEHTTKDSLTSTIYWPPAEENGGLGWYKCMHAHCQKRFAQDYDKWIAERVVSSIV